jgi:hypothetical protein
LLRTGGLLLGTRCSSTGGPTSTKILLARSRPGATPSEHGNRQLQLCKRCDDPVYSRHGVIRRGAMNIVPFGGIQSHSGAVQMAAFR